MNAYIDCAMHLIFHDIVAYCVERVEEFMKTRLLTPDFEKMVNVYMIDIQSYQLEWCKMNTFPKKNNGWLKMKLVSPVSSLLFTAFSS